MKLRGVWDGVSRQEEVGMCEIKHSFRVCFPRSLILWLVMFMMEQDEVRMYEVLGFTLSKVVLSCSMSRNDCTHLYPHCAPLLLSLKLNIIIGKLYKFSNFVFLSIDFKKIPKRVCRCASRLQKKVSITSLITDNLKAGDASASKNYSSKVVSMINFHEICDILWR